MSYHSFINEDGDEYGSFEVFYLTQDEAQAWREHVEIDRNPGWYWWACFPGCLPDGEPSGPFDTKDQAYADAQDVA